nr:hypothetical protein [Tanacetum cinerariifolium]
DDKVVEKDANVQGRLVKSQAQIYKIDLEHADKVLSMQDDVEEPAELQETEAQARKNIIVYLKNMAGFKMEYFNRMSYDDILPIFEKYLSPMWLSWRKVKSSWKKKKAEHLKGKEKV